MLYFANLIKKGEIMEATLEIAEITTQQKQIEERLYTVQEVFDCLDKEFIDFYGEYGRKLVNTRREEWNQDGWLNFKTF